MKPFTLGILAFVIATFATQATSHFAINADHYAQVEYLRTEAIFAFGFLAMFVQGAVLSFFYLRTREPGQPLLRTLGFAWLAGAFLVSYIAFAEAAKYAVPSIPSWIGTELAAGAVQFTLFGVLLHLAFRGQPRTAH